MPTVSPPSKEALPAEVIELMRRIEERLQQPADQPYNTITVAELVRGFLAAVEAKRTRGDVADYTAWKYRHYLGRWVTIAPCNVPAKDIELHHVPEDLRTNSHFCQTVKSCFKWAFQEGKLKCCPLANLQQPPSGERTRILTDEECNALLEACPLYFKRFVWCLLRTGARTFEIRTLRWRDVDFEKRIFKIVEYKAKKRMKKKKPYRPIALDKGVIELLHLLRAEKIDDGEGLRLPGPDDVVFRGRHSQPLTKDAVCQSFRRACKRAGIDQSGERAVCYTMRHTSGTDITNSNLNQKIVAEILGHSQVKTTERYQHIQENRLVNAMDQVREAWTSGKPANMTDVPGAKKRVRQPSLFDAASYE
jgi:integrase